LLPPFFFFSSFSSSSFSFSFSSYSFSSFSPSPPPPPPPPPTSPPPPPVYVHCDYLTGIVSWIYRCTLCYIGEGWTFLAALSLHSLEEMWWKGYKVEQHIVTITVSLMVIKFITYNWLLSFKLSLCRYHEELDLKKCLFHTKLRKVFRQMRMKWVYSLGYYITKNLLCVYRSPAVVRIMTARTLQLAGHVAVVWDTGKHTEMFSGIWTPRKPIRRSENNFKLLLGENGRLIELAQDLLWQWTFVVVMLSVSSAAMVTWFSLL
jgi:hypothetical protein